MAVRPMKVWNAATSTWDDVAVSQRGDVVLNSLVTAKGQIIGASASGTPAAIPAGTNGQFLIADSSSPAGVKFDNTTSASLTIEGTTAYQPRINISNTANDNTSGYFVIQKRRGSAIVQNGDALGQISFSGYNGSAYVESAGIQAVVDATPGASNDMPGRLVFFTCADGQGFLTERMRIDNAGLITGTGTSLGAWTAYTPTLGGFTAGSGTPTSGAYVQIGKVVLFRAVWTFGTGSAAAAARPTLTLPVTAASATGADVTALFFDTSAGAYYQASAYQSSTTVVTMGVLGTNGINNAASTTSPMTWATGDQIILSGSYEIA